MIMPSRALGTGPATAQIDAHSCNPRVIQLVDLSAEIGRTVAAPQAVHQKHNSVTLLPLGRHIDMQSKLVAVVEFQPVALCLVRPMTADPELGSYGLQVPGFQ